MVCEGLQNAIPRIGAVSDVARESEVEVFREPSS